MKSGRPWTRQIKTIEIMKGDAITDNGQETWNLLAERKIENVILCGVHLNMCVFGPALWDSANGEARKKCRSDA